MTAGPAGPAAPPGPEDDDGRTFEQLVADLEAITDRLASGEVGIEAAADLYERAERLHALASTRLARVQERVERLSSGPSASRTAVQE